MIFTRLKLTNFGRFYGHQQIDVGPGVYVIHGRNGLGKTTLLNGVRWGLYGHFTNRQGQEVPPEVILNRAARREGERQFSVELHITDGSDRFLIRRTQVISEGTAPASELYVERNDTPLSSADARRAVDRLLNEDVSRFFLFDGEQLQQYESLLLHEDTQSQLIKQSIEQILGLPVLEQTIGDLAAVRDDLSRRMARQARSDQRLEQAGLRAEQASSDLDSKRREIDELQRELELQQGIINQRDAFLQRFESSMESITRLDSLDSQMQGLRQRRDELRSLLGSGLQNVWRDVLESSISVKRRALQGELERHQEAAQGADLRVLAERALQDGSCPVCHQSLSAEAEHEMHSFAGEETGELGSPPDVNLLIQLTGISSSGQLDTAIDLDERIGDVDGQLVALAQEASRLRTALQDLPAGEVTTAVQERDRAQQEIGRLGQLVRTAESERDDIAERLRRAEEQIRSGDGAVEPHLARALDLTDGLTEVFTRAKDAFRDELRTAVEASATLVFRQLITEQAYASLSINDSYGLNILDEHGEVVTGRSAGQEQLVALALVAALNQNATRRATVVMDTPFGRLDPAHRTRVLRFASEMADQVFLLVHGGEVADEDLAAVASVISGEFRLEYDDPDRTTLVPRSRL